jgi:hypothetical protein
MTVDQLALFGARVTDPDSSHFAAALHRDRLRDRVERALLRAGAIGCTDWELTALAGLEAADQPSVGKRRQEIGAHRTDTTRPSPKGVPCHVYVHPSFVRAVAS